MLISLGPAPRRLLSRHRLAGRHAPKLRKRKRRRLSTPRLLPIRRRSEFFLPQCGIASEPTRLTANPLRKDADSTNPPPPSSSHKDGREATSAASPNAGLLAAGDPQ